MVAKRLRTRQGLRWLAPDPDGLNKSSGSPLVKKFAHKIKASKEAIDGNYTVLTIPILKKRSLRATIKGTTYYEKSKEGGSGLHLREYGY